jgi:hypothetical protein
MTVYPSVSALDNSAAERIRVKSDAARFKHLSTHSSFGCNPQVASFQMKTYTPRTARISTATRANA